MKNNFGKFLVAIIVIVVFFVLSGTCQAAQRAYWCDGPASIGGIWTAIDSARYELRGNGVVLADTIVTSGFVADSICDSIDAIIDDSIGVVDVKATYFSSIFAPDDSIVDYFPVRQIINTYTIGTPSAANLSVVYLFVDDIAGNIPTKGVELKVWLKNDQRFVMDTCNDRYLASYEEWKKKPDSIGKFEIELKKNLCYDDPNMVYHAELVVKRGANIDIGDFIVRDSVSQMLKVEED